MNFIIVYGDPVDGFNFVGPFDDRDEAVRYAEFDVGTDWWIAELDAPAEESAPLKWYAVTGRLHGDDEDTCWVYQCSDVVAARGEFIKNMRGFNDILPEDVDRLGEDANVYINSVVVSATPIEREN